jgi:hypothetical protein
MRDIPSIEYAGGRCGNYGFCRPQIYEVSGNFVPGQYAQAALVND